MLLRPGVPPAAQRREKHPHCKRAKAGLPGSAGPLLAVGEGISSTPHVPLWVTQEGCSPHLFRTKVRRSVFCHGQAWHRRRTKTDNKQSPSDVPCGQNLALLGWCFCFNVDPHSIGALRQYSAGRGEMTWSQKWLPPDQAPLLHLGWADPCSLYTPPPPTPRVGKSLLAGVC